ncbi:protein EMBRYO DEFECTIVE 514-like [Zingiber officinale]|uniref:Uncharacterized protein n=1 Tax=Zingiber officinale TaxID=94328 RepID=A0A8J5FKZ8_ZINOF|nr:protein EMBRYO DEFECTIVE 514-like [Zingiber officinale]KAG6486217.1 hypothetical protein ZIOFF_054787 [Zingiber officinale]
MLKECECGAEKRGREEGNVEGRDSKRRKQKVEESLEEVRTEGASLGPKVFGSATEMYRYFLKLVHSWSANLDLNQYEHLVLLDLLKKGHPESTIKIGEGIKAFQVRDHPIWNTRCFFLIRVNGSSDAFSFRKCVDKILPLPSHLKVDSSSGNSSGNRNSSRGGR